MTISSSYFTAGIGFSEDGIVTHAAPILKYMRKWHILDVEAYCNKKGFTFAYHE